MYVCVLLACLLACLLAKVRSFMVHEQRSLQMVVVNFLKLAWPDDRPACPLIALDTQGQLIAGDVEADNLVLSCLVLSWLFLRLPREAKAIRL